MSSKQQKHRKSKEEIARLFDLPERQSKIATIMKQDDQAYCICRSSDCSRFMIGCDNCEEWFHGDCIKISEKESKHIKQFFCDDCRTQNPTLQIVFRPLDRDRHAQPQQQHQHQQQQQTSQAASQQQQQQQQLHHAETDKRKRNRDSASGCGHCAGCLAPADASIEQRRCKQQSNAGQLAKKRKRDKTTYKRRNKSTQPPEVFKNPELEGIRQCYGPGCRNAARSQSKYCSDECGLNLASSRIFQVLPQRLQEWNLTNSHAEQENKKQLEVIRHNLHKVELALTELKQRHLEIDMIVQNAKSSTIDPNELDKNNDLEDEQSMYCITCGHEIHSRTAIKHMEKCFNKYESQASFGSSIKTRSEVESLFCDFYNPASKTFCKRLRVLCPEHCKDPKISDSDVCGCPLVVNEFTPNNKFCRAPKKSCFRHYVWEKIRRAEIDMERVRQWIKFDELCDQERQIRHQMASRAGVLGLMLHSTYNHEVIEMILSQQRAAQEVASAAVAAVAVTGNGNKN